MPCPETFDRPKYVSYISRVGYHLAHMTEPSGGRAEPHGISMSSTNTHGGELIDATSLEVDPYNIAQLTITPSSGDDQLHAQREHLARQREQWNAYERQSAQDLREQTQQLTENQAEFAQRQARETERLERQRADFARQREQWNAYEHNQTGRQGHPCDDARSNRRLEHMTDLCDELQALIQQINHANEPTDLQEDE